MGRGLFITFEGTAGSGKSTQAQLLYQHLQNRKYPVILTREPGSTRIGEQIRSMLLDLQHKEIAITTEILLFSAARAQLVHERIRPHLEAGGIVLGDRYADSTYAYQGYGSRYDLEELVTITRIATGGLLPDLTLYLDLPVEEGLERKHRTSALAGQHPGWNRLDARDRQYHQRVAEGFLKLMENDPTRWRRIDARPPIDEIARRIAAEVEPLLSRVTPLDH